VAIRNPGNGVAHAEGSWQAATGGLMEVLVQHLAAVQFEVKARRHRVMSNQPPGNGGFDEEITPPALLLALTWSPVHRWCG